MFEFGGYPTCAGELVFLVLGMWYGQGFEQGETDFGLMASDKISASEAQTKSNDQSEAIKRIAHAVSGMLSKFNQRIARTGDIAQAIQTQADRIKDLEASMASEAIERNHQAVNIKTGWTKCKA